MFVPSDVLLEIAAYVDHADRVSLALVCFAWADALVPTVRSRLVYLVRHRWHSLSLEQHLAKHGHLIRELCIGDSKMSVDDFNKANYAALRAWLTTNCHRIMRLRVLNGSVGAGNIIFLLGCIGAVPFYDDNHRNSVMRSCAYKILVTLPQVDNNQPISGWQCQFLSLEHPKLNYPNQLHWYLTRAWVERLSIVGTSAYFDAMRTWPRLRVLEQLSPPSSVLLAGSEKDIPNEQFPQLRRLTPLRHGSPYPTGLEDMPSGSSINRVVRDVIVKKRGIVETVKQIAGMGRQITALEELNEYPKMFWSMMDNPAVFHLLDIRSITLDHAAMTWRFDLFFDVYALNTPVHSVEYLQIVGRPNLQNGQFTPRVEEFFTPARLRVIPERFPKLRYLLVENLPWLDDVVLEEMLFATGHSQPRLRSLRRIIINNCGITGRGTQLLDTVNNALWLN